MRPSSLNAAGRNRDSQTPGYKYLKPFENDSRGILHNATQYQTPMPNTFQFFIRFRYPQLPPGQAPLLLSAAPLSAGEEAMDETMAKARSSARQSNLMGASNLMGVQRPGAQPAMRVADTAGIPSSPGCRRCQTTVGLRRTETYCARCRLALRLDELIGANKLAPEAWERIRSLCRLPKAAESLPPAKQSRALFQLVNSFASRVPRREQSGLSDSELAARLLALPGLSLALVKIIGQKIKADRRDEAAGKNAAQNYNDTDENCGSSDRKQRGENGSGASPVERQPISAALFTKVAVRQGCYCYWCGIRVVRVAQIPAANRLLKNGETILYYAGDDLREEAVGTIDHLLRVSDGGDNSLANLVVSCLGCNRERDRLTVAYGRPFARRRVPCGSCGGRFFHADWGCCSICGAAPSVRRKNFNPLRIVIKFIAQKLLRRS